MPIIILKNESPSFGLFGPISIEIDGKICAKLARSQRAEYRIESGIHSIRALSQKLHSPSVTFSLNDRERIGFACSLTGFWRQEISLHKVFQETPRNRFEVIRNGGPSQQKKTDGPSDYDGVPWNVVLNVKENATQNEVRKAYLKLIKKFHPDHVIAFEKTARDAAEREAREINIAYTVAKKLRKR
jgi:hypothetical protein